MDKVRVHPKQKYPGYFRNTQRDLSEIPINRRQAMIWQHGKVIREGNHKPVAEIVKLVIASDFRPEILESAKKAMSRITTFEFGKPWPLEQFDMSAFYALDRPYYYGALFECLPQDIAARIYSSFYLYSKPPLPVMVRGGNVLLRFSAASMRRWCSAHELAMSYADVRKSGYAASLRAAQNSTASQGHCRGSKESYRS